MKRQGWVALAVAVGLAWWLWVLSGSGWTYLANLLGSWPPSVKELPGAGLIGTALWIYRKVLRAFGTSPDDLLKEARQTFQLPSLIGKTDVRMEFREELEDVLAALEPKRLVIFLDDLDRCSPAQTVAVMESINYLSSIEGCFFILGMDRDKVATAVGLQLGEAAIEERRRLHPERAPQMDSEKAAVRGEDAKDYLKKIVNVTVGVRDPEPEEVERYLSEPQWEDAFEMLKKGFTGLC